jgi:hypothetical protein
MGGTCLAGQDSYNNEEVLAIEVKQHQIAWETWTQGNL